MELRAHKMSRAVVSSRSRFNQPWPAGRQIMPAADLTEFQRTIHPEAVNRESAHEPPATRERGPLAFHATAL